MGDEPVLPDEPGEPRESVRAVDRFRQGAAGGALAAGMLGLAHALDWAPEVEEVVVVEEAAGPPPRTERIVMRLDPDDPADSIVMIRTWLDPD